MEVPTWVNQTSMNAVETEEQEETQDTECERQENQEMEELAQAESEKQEVKELDRCQAREEKAWKKVVGRVTREQAVPNQREKGQVRERRSGRVPRGREEQE